MKQKRNRLLELMSKRKVRQQLYLMYVFAVFLPIVVIGSFLLKNTSELLTSNYENLLESDNLRVRIILYEILKKTYDVSESVFLEKEIREILALQEENDSPTGFYDSISINSYIAGNEEIEDITIYTDNPIAIRYAHFEPVADNVREADWYRKAFGQSGVFWTAVEKLDRYGNSSWNLALVRKLVSEDGNQAVLVIRISDRYLQSRILSREYRIMISAENGRIVYHSARTGYGKLQELHTADGGPYYEYLGPIWEDGNKIFTKVASLYPYNSGTVLYIATLHETAYSDMGGILLTCLLIILIALVVPAVLIHFFTRYFTRRVNTLRDEMQRAAKEEYGGVSDIRGDDELAEAFADLQTMVQKIKEKDIRMYEARLGEQQLLNEQQVMEMKMLASQINPHFFYNTLESIRMQALTAGNREVANAIKLLGKSMRYVLENTGTSVVSLQKELSHIEIYLQIQKIRFGSRVNYRIINEQGLDPEDYLLLPLLLQPIVENAIVHGLEQTEGEGHIEIAVTTPDEEALQITVSDDGCGMDQETLEELRLRMEKPTMDRRRSIGLCNINQRIRLCYGNDYGIEIESVPDEGTRVLVRLPIERPDRD